MRPLTGASPIGLIGLSAAVNVVSGLCDRVNDTVPILHRPMVVQIVSARDFNSRCVKLCRAILLRPPVLNHVMVRGMIHCFNGNLLSWRTLLQRAKV